jgi:hypothetical protein
MSEESVLFFSDHLLKQSMPAYVMMGNFDREGTRLIK